MKFEYRFSFEQEEELPDSIRINPDCAYDAALGYGFAVSIGRSKFEDLRNSWPGEYFFPAVKSFLIDAPNGNYSVKAVLGGPYAPSSTTIKAGLGQLMLSEVHAAADQSVQESFAVHVEDGQLKLAFGGKAPAVRSIAIERTPGIPTLFLAGDSTMTNQPSGQYPYSGWGQMLGECFTAGLAVSNQARSGRSSKSFIEENRLLKIWKRIRTGDYLLVQFAHNDEKDNEGGTHAFTTYKEYLKVYVDGARGRGALPVLVSAMHRRFFDEHGFIKDTHGDYLVTAAQLAEELDVPLIDLAAKSKRLYEQAGEERSKELFMWVEPNQYETLRDGAQDNTHFSEKGASAIARLVADGIREAGIRPLQSFLR